MQMRSILTAASLAGLVALAACVAPSDTYVYNDGCSRPHEAYVYNDGRYPAGAPTTSYSSYDPAPRYYSQRTYVTPAAPAWARPDLNHSNWDHYAP